MCLAKIITDSDDGQEALAEEVASLKVESGRILVTTLFGEQKEIASSIREIDFMTSRVVVAPLSAS